MTNEIKSNAHHITIRPFRLKDLERVVELEREIFPDPWPRSAFEDILSERGWGALIAETDTREIAGYACFLAIPPEGHLANIAVAPDHRRKSVARRLLDNILDTVNRSRCEYLLLEVRPSNEDARAFYERQGFTFLYRRPNYYSNPIEDAVVMVRYLGDESAG